jgi:pimeloyl-ACP methyl ester carboxylesterase
MSGGSNRVARAVLTGALSFALLAQATSPAGADRVDARTAPIRTIDVAWGHIGYRSLGHGPPLLLLVGGGSPAPSIDDWPPAFVDRLAQHHRVLLMDYEGVGHTTLRPGMVTLPRLAQDTADFLAALHLHRVDVLGWSMGGFVAQLLAIRHPSIVRRLVLCATALGDGSARGASVSGSPSYPAQWLFPFNRQNRARANAFERAVHSYPNYYEGSEQASIAEGFAIFLWLQGSVAEGHHAARIRQPVLIGDGRHDVILPMPDSRRLARTLRYARLEVYSDAGHGFLVQHEADWVRRVEQFLRAG